MKWGIRSHTGGSGDKGVGSERRPSGLPGAMFVGHARLGPIKDVCMNRNFLHRVKPHS